MSGESTASDVDSRFAFGANWARFLSVVDETRIAAAEESLQSLLGRERLDGLLFLDVGSGSGLLSLAAHRLGARVHSFDFDEQSVACTRELRRRFAADSPEWTVERGSALDEAYLSALPRADVVYSWGVLHHTGEMWRAIELVAGCVADGGDFALAIYNDQGRTSEQWRCVKRMYQALPSLLRPPLVAACGAVLMVHRIWQMLVTMLLRSATLQSPVRSAGELAETVTRPNPRGMHRWYDLVDWVGGWPFEVARPGEVFEFLSARGLELTTLRTVGGKMGCNEFVFHRR